MDTIFYFIMALFVVIFIWRVLPAKGISNISAEDLKVILNDKNKQYVDVRTPGEYKGKHIQEFKNIPLDQLAQKAEKELSKDKEVIVICQSGMRSMQAARILKKMGFTKIVNVKGGMSAWPY